MLARRTLLSGISAAMLADDAEAFPRGSYGVAAPGGTPTLVQHVGSTTNDNNGIAGNAFTFTLPNVVGAGNCLILGISYPYSGSRTVALSDSSGDTWPSAAITTTDSSNLAQKIFVLPNATSALHTITLTFDTAIKPVAYAISEFYNVATSSPVDGTHGTASVASPNVSAGSYTPTTNNDANGGHLIWTITRSNDKVGANNSFAASTIAPTGSQSLLDADNTCTIPGSSSFYVQATNGAINPGFTITQSTGTNFVCSSVALKAASAGTAPAAGIRIKRILHATYTLGGSSAVFQFPCDGNLLYTAAPAGSDQNPISAVTDSNSQTYTNPGAATEPQCFYKQNATPSNSLKITFSVTGPQFSLRMHDIVGANASSYKNTNGVYTTAPGSGSVADNLPNFTPSAAPGLTVTTVGFGTGPVTGMASGAPAGSVFDLVYYTGETDQDRMDNADAQAHVYHSTTGAQTWNFGITSASWGSTAFATAICFV